MFNLANCTDAVFEQLNLPAWLRADERKSPVGRDLVFDLESRSALIPHPYHHSDYPDRGLSFYVDGRHFNANELVRRDDGPDRYEIWFEKAEDESVVAQIAVLFQDAISVMDWAMPNTRSIVIQRKPW